MPAWRELEQLEPAMNSAWAELRAAREAASE